MIVPHWKIIILEIKPYIFALVSLIMRLLALADLDQFCHLDIKMNTTIDVIWTAERCVGSQVEDCLNRDTRALAP